MSRDKGRERDDAIVLTAGVLVVLFFAVLVLFSA